MPPCIDRRGVLPLLFGLLCCCSFSALLLLPLLFGLFCCLKLKSLGSLNHRQALRARASAQCAVVSFETFLVSKTRRLPREASLDPCKQFNANRHFHATKRHRPRHRLTAPAQCCLTHTHCISLPDFLSSFAGIAACRFLSSSFACIVCLPFPALPALLSTALHDMLSYFTCA